MIVAFAVAAVFLSDEAQAGRSWICSINSAVECIDGGECGPPDLGELERPTFLRVDAGRKQITILAPESRRGEVTKIGTVKEIEDLLVLTGVESGRAWSMVISKEGYMTLSVTYDGVTWSAFGNSMPESR
jgi:hypothetical protein